MMGVTHLLCCCNKTQKLLILIYCNLSSYCSYMVRLLPLVYLLFNLMNGIAMLQFKAQQTPDFPFGPVFLNTGALSQATIIDMFKQDVDW